MNKLIKASLLSGFIFFATSAYCQEKKDDSFGQDVKQAGKTTSKVVKKAGKKVGEVGAKSAAKVKDKSLKEKGPHGETVYIDKYQRKYYVNKDAKRIYID